MNQKDFKGRIPPIADKEKRGHKIRMTADDPYIQELISRGKITPQLAAQLPNQSVVDYILKTFPQSNG